jgi:DNA polymerase-1
VVAVTAPVVLVIDGNSLVHRSFHAMAESSQPDWAVRGLLTQLVAAVDRVRPTTVVVGFDDAARSLRRERWPSYKANRTEKLPSLVDQLASAIAVMRELGLAVVVPGGLEADDVSASAAARARQAGGRSVIVTSDRDAFALIDEHTSVLRIINGGVDASPLITPERLVLLLGVRPEQYRDFAALRGDPSDNLPGVRGVGPRTAARLLSEFGSAAAAFADLDAVRARLGAGVATRLSADGARAAWELNCQVMAMHDDVPLGTDLRIGPGVLPVAPDAVDAVFAAQHLVWTAGRAAHLLAGAPESMPRERPPEPWAERPVLRRRERRMSAPRAAALVPAVDQLSLF